MVLNTILNNMANAHGEYRKTPLPPHLYNAPGRIFGMTPAQKKFADKYLELLARDPKTVPPHQRSGRVGSQAVRETYGGGRPPKDPTKAHRKDRASILAKELLLKPEIKFYIASQVEKLKEHLYYLSLNAKSENVQLSATINALDRVFGKPVQSNEITGANGGPISVQSLELIYSKALKLDDTVGRDSGDFSGAQ